MSSASTSTSTPATSVPNGLCHRRSETETETFKLSDAVLPRLFTGLWQLSSPAWGSARLSKMRSQFQNYVKNGFVAYDMADHYGDAEIQFGQFRSSYQGPERIFGGTKYCVFDCDQAIPDEILHDAVAQRLSNMKCEKLDLLQFHWQNYRNRDYIRVSRVLAADARISRLGLCNFDTKRMKEIIDADVPIVSNQVQFSLIDQRPLHSMAALCQESGVKLLTYGTLCGGFLASKWLGREAPDAFDPEMTPSLRKYLEMIGVWGGWGLFQRLLRALERVAARHGNVSVSAVATRWVLDQTCVGAVIVGTRMGIADHSAENLQMYGWSLDEKDLGLINEVLEDSNSQIMAEIIGDCGGEYGERG